MHQLIQGFPTWVSAFPSVVCRPVIEIFGTLWGKLGALYEGLKADASAAISSRPRNRRRLADIV